MEKNYFLEVFKANLFGIISDRNESYCEYGMENTPLIIVCTAHTTSLNLQSEFGMGNITVHYVILCSIAHYRRKK